MESLYRAYYRRLEETDSKFFRYLYPSIEWDERLIGIKGARGVGKSTMLLQHIKRSFPDRTKAFYASLDNIWFSSHPLSELVEYAFTHGVTHLFLDEVHRYPGWIQAIKNIYDDYPQLHIIFTGSSLLEIDNAEADLSRRLRIYTLDGMSFREYLELNEVAHLPAITLEELLTHHTSIASTITHDLKVLPHFESYFRMGYYPFYLETSSVESYFERIQQVVSTVIDNDIPAIEPIEYETLQKIKRLLVVLAQMKPFEPSIQNLCALLSTTRNQLIRLFSLLDRSALLRLLYYEGKNLKSLGKPEKILFNNPNLMPALSSDPDTGTLRESYVTSMLSNAHTLNYPRQGDLLVDGIHLFEVGGKHKGYSQIKDIPDSYVAADDIEIGFGNKIPLWMFGLLY